ncbi:MAG: hypothetical protein IKE74_09000 [Mogibacterium sp.]|nr:hypothetical protein [Mogibacterium sp.]
MSKTMSTNKKPVCFNAVQAMMKIDSLEAEVERLKKEKTNLEIKCRILEERLNRDS